MLAKMKVTVGWIFLTFLLVDAKSTNCNHHQLLKQIFNTALEVEGLSELLNRTYVDVVFDKNKCACKDFCVAQKIISQAVSHHNHTHSKLARALSVYSKMKDCPYTASGVKYPLLTLRDDIIHCVQQHLSHPRIQCCRTKVD
ncbi:hypothetical protein AALO_G00270820 [Alosa alosa]|uniref:Uncharacterized protein n=1 Tax=Alosa alosa TaxID=278164 RepID=A0AAV6FM89_9TELE|nr:hypothetical protein AALO_G00270820 [Alosa alosa]